MVHTIWYDKELDLLRIQFLEKQKGQVVLGRQYQYPNIEARLPGIIDRLENEAVSVGKLVIREITKGAYSCPESYHEIKPSSPFWDIQSVWVSSIINRTEVPDKCATVGVVCTEADGYLKVEYTATGSTLIYYINERNSNPC